MWQDTGIGRQDVKLELEKQNGIRWEGDFMEEFDFDMGVLGGRIADGVQNLHFTSSWASGFKEVTLALLQDLVSSLK